MAINTNIRVEFTEANNVSKDTFPLIYAINGKMELSLPVTSDNDAVVDIANLANPRILFVTSTLPVIMVLKSEGNVTTTLIGDMLMYGFNTSEDADPIVSLTISRPAFTPPDPQTDPATVETPAVINVKVLGV